MASWAALNAEAAPRAALEDAGAVATAEAQEARNAALYGRALRLQQQQKVEEAATLYTELLETSTGLSTRLRYLCAKNLATLEAERRAFDAALQRFSEALALDDTDVLVWYQMGKAALATQRLWLGRQAFEAGYELDATFWPLVHALCDVYHAVGDGAAYQRVARVLLEMDPGAGRVGGPLAAMDNAMDPQFRVCSSQSSQAQPTLKRATPALQASLAAAKRRKLLVHSASEKELAVNRRAPLQYLLRQSSWLSLGKLLLEAYDDVTSEQDPQNTTPSRRVCVSTDFVDEPPPLEPEQLQASASSSDAVTVPTPLDDQTAEEAAHVIDLAADESVSKADDGTAAEPIEIDEADDGDQPEESTAVEINRRKSRRHQEKLREEHELAAKLAREKNLAYRLQAYVPDIGNRVSDTDFVNILFRVDGDSVILEHANGDLVHKFENVLPAAPSDETAADTTDSQGKPDDKTRVEPNAVNRGHLQHFVETRMHRASGTDIVDLLRAYLNQCGEWADQKMIVTSEDDTQAFRMVCLWAEKVVRGHLDIHPTTPTEREHERSVRSRVSVNRHNVGGLTISARLFLLELHIDELTYNQTEQGQSRSRRLRRSYFAQLDDIVREAQVLLVDICWSDDRDTESNSDTGNSWRLFVRLFWLSGSASQMRGNSAAAKEYFDKCRQSLAEVEQDAVVSLPNLRCQAVISIPVVDEKITSLQFSAVSTEVQEMATTSRFDEAQGRLLSHFFPASDQAQSRMTELLDDFSAFKQQEHDQGESAGDVDQSDTNSSLLELLLESIENSTSSKCADKIRILLVILSKFIDILSDKRRRFASGQKKSETERHMLSVIIQAVELTVDKLAAVVMADSETDDTVCPYTGQAVVAVITRLLEPRILLLFDSPRDVLQVIYEVVDQLDKTTEKLASQSNRIIAPLVATAAISLQTIRSLSSSEREGMLTIMTAPPAGAKSKKKQSVRLDRLRSYAQSVLTLLAAHVPLLVSLLSKKRIRELMEVCCTLLKEEEETTQRYRDGDKTAKRALAVGSVLFLQLVVSFCSEDRDTEGSLKKVVGLIRLLHERLGDHELCTLKCFDKTIDSGSCPGDSFAEVASRILQDRYEDHDAMQRTRRRLRKLVMKGKQKIHITGGNNDGEVSGDDRTGEDDADEEEEGFDHTLAQCYRCLFDTHMLAGTVDHKTGGSIGDLESTSTETARRVARFAIPIMLRRPPRSNAQKKENLKLLFAIQQAIESTKTEGQTPLTPPQQLQRYLSPTTLLSWEGDVPLEVLDSMSQTRADSCLDDLWFLLGENFILVRVRKRSNLSELVEMERKIKERIAYLLKDIQHYRPCRIKSWMRLGRSTKELYQVASDACALIMGRKWRKSEFLSGNRLLGGFNTTETPECTVDTSAGLGDPTFQDVVLNSSLFEIMKTWHDTDDATAKASYRIQFQNALTPVEEPESDLVPAARSFSIEEAAELYLTQVVEFSRRCFMMAAALSTRKHECGGSNEVVLDDTSGTARLEESSEGSSDVMQIAVDAYEECGLLMYNQLQEFAMLRHDNAAIKSGAFPVSHYGQILSKTLFLFQEGIRLSSSSNPEAHDVRFRLNYMTGKVMKKLMWLQKVAENSKVNSDHSNGATSTMVPADVMKYFARAEQDHEDGKMDKSIVHAFYQLQAMRLTLILAEPNNVENLRIACEHFFEEVNDDDESAGEGEEVDKIMDQEGKKEEDDSFRATKDDVAAILTAAEDTGNKDLLYLAQGWLFFNVVDALESISDEDRYFHPSRYALAKAMYHHNDVVHRLSTIDEEMLLPSPSASAKNCITALAARKAKKKHEGDSSAEIALKELHPLFDKRRPQVVAIWLSEHVPTSKKFEELNQRQIKFDFCRLKYFTYFVKLLEENEAYGRLKEIGSWVLSCKEEHDAIDEMLAIVLRARSAVQLIRLREYVAKELVEQLERHKKWGLEQAQSEQEKHSAEAEGVIDLTTERKEGNDSESASEALLKEVSKAYVNYLDIAHSSTRLARVMSVSAFDELFLLAAFPVVCLYLVGATEFPKTFEVLERDEILTTAHIADVAQRLRAILLDDLTLAACASLEWKPLLHAARAFCEDRWPDRQSGKMAGAKPARKARQSKPTLVPPSGATTASIVTATHAATHVMSDEAPMTTPGDQDQRGHEEDGEAQAHMEVGDAETSTS